MDPAATPDCEAAASILDEAAALVALGWTQDASARDAFGEAVDYDDDRAEAWCMSGATSRALMRSGIGVPESHRAFAIADVLIAREVARATVGGAAGMIDYNDALGRTQAECVAAIERAAAECRSRRPVYRASGAVVFPERRAGDLAAEHSGD